MDAEELQLLREEIISAYATGRRDFWRIESEGVDLSGVDLRYARLDGAIFRNANLSGANLSNVYIFRLSTGQKL